MSVKSLTAPTQSGLAPKEAGVPRERQQPQLRRVPPVPTPAGMMTKLGAANEAGLGLGSASAPTLRALGLDVPDGMLPEGGGMGDTPLTFPCEAIPGPGGPLVAPFSCSRSTFDFLRTNVLRNPGDMETVSMYGLVRFDRRVGTHQIPLDRGGENTPNALAKNGAIVVPDGQALIVTDFVAFALRSVWGLPGALEEIDPSAMARQVCFALMQQDGAQVLPQQTLIQGKTFCNGTPFTRDPAGHGYPALTQTAKMPVEATYTVSVPPYPGFPDIVGARVKGYMINQQLLAAVQDRPVTNG